MYEEIIEKTFGLTDMMIGAAGLHLYNTVAAADANRRVLGYMAGWAGGPPGRESRAPIIGPMKALELLCYFDGEISLTPVPGLPMSLGYKGGVRRQRTEDPNLHFLNTCSAFSGECDLMHALLDSYALEHAVHLHHVGFRHPSREEMLSVVAADEKRLGVPAIEAPATDHERYYLPVRTKEHPHGVYWIEHQFFPEGVHVYAIHWDLVTLDALGLLEFSAKHLGTEVITWDAGPDDPIGRVTQTNRDEVPHSFMTRYRWWDIN